jgi:6-pyruvoyl-tetrahydropterin synthase
MEDNFLKAEIEKSFYITCTHELPGYPACNEQHEHDYRIIINVLAWLNEDTGMVMNYNDMDTVMEKYHKKNLNNIFDKPTVENLARAIGSDIVMKLEHYSRVTVSVMESENTKITISL